MRLTWLWLVTLVVSARAAASPVPGMVPFTARLADAGMPFNGVVSLKFQIFDASAGGTAVWTELYPSNTATNGLVFLDLGSQTTLDATVFNGGTKYLEVSVNGSVMTPRLEIGSSPYALHAATSDTLGSLAETDVQKRVSGACATGAISTINDDGTVVCAPVGSTYTGTNGVSVTGTNVGLSTLGCASGYVWKYNGATFACQPDADTTYTGSGGVNITGTTVSLSTTGCTTGSVWKFNGAAFACQADADTTYSGSSGVNITGTTVSLSTTGCAAGYVWKYNGGSWACQPDANTTYTAASPITITGTTVGLATGGCATGFVWKFNGTSWACQLDADSAGAAVHAGAGATFSNSVTTIATATVTLPAPGRVVAVAQGAFEDQGASANFVACGLYDGVTLIENFVWLDNPNGFIDQSHTAFVAESTGGSHTFSLNCSTSGPSIAVQVVQPKIIVEYFPAAI